MERPLKEEPEGDPFISKELAENEQVISKLWESAGVLFRWRWFIVGITGVVAIASIILSLLMVNWYAASARLLSPESGGTSPLSAALASNLSTAASALLGGGSNGDYLRYKTILSSRTMNERVVEEFNLIEVYETQESIDPENAAIQTLAENTSFPVDDEDEYLSVIVMDTDPQRAADMANFMVRELNNRNSELAAQDAGNYRKFVEARYGETLRQIDSLKDATQEFQQINKVFNLQDQATAFLEQIALIRAETFALEIEYEVLKQQYGTGNPRVMLAKHALDTAEKKGDDVMAGRSDILPVAREDFPEVTRAYVELEQEMLIQKSILDIIAPMYEQARFQEERRYEAVQVIDKAIPAVRKAKPRRSLIVIGATLSAFLVSVLFVLVNNWWQQSGTSMLYRLGEEAKKAK